MKRIMLLKKSMALLVISFLAINVVPIGSWADPVPHRVQGQVYPNPGDGALAYPGNATFYIQNMTNEGMDVDVMLQGGGIEYYDQAIEDTIIDWEPGDPGVLIVNVEHGTYPGGNRTGYVAYSTATLNITGYTLFPPVDLQRIPIPTLDSNGTGFINISWSALPDPSGLIAGYTVYRSTTNDSDGSWSLVGGSVNAPLTDLWFNDTSVTSGVDYYYSLKVCFTGYQNDIPGNIDNYENQYFGAGSGPITSSPGPPTVDFILIMDAAGGVSSEIPDMTVAVGTVITGYAAAFNNTDGYLYDVSVSWSVINSGGAQASTAPPTGTSSTFDAGSQGGSAQWKADDGSGHIDYVNFTILPPTVDFIIIVDTPGTGTAAILDMIVDVDMTITGYAAAFNSTVGYIYDVAADWSVLNIGSNASTSPTTGSDTSDFYSGHQGGTAIWNADYVGVFADSVIFTINPPTVDYIEIVDTAGTGAAAIADQTVDVGVTITGYAASFNDTIGFIGDVSVTWTVIPSSSEDATTSPGSGTSSDFYSGTIGGSVVWKADDGAGHIGVVNFTISPPTVDYIDIVDTAGTGVTAIADQTVNIGVTITGHAAGFNTTSGYIGDVTVDWMVIPSSSEDASTSPGTGTGSDFYSGTIGGSVDWIADYNAGAATDSVTITINPPTVDYIDIVDAAGIGAPTIANQTVEVGFTITGYAASFNSIIGYIGDVSVTWTVIPSGGENATTAPGSGTTSDFYSGTIGGSVVWMADYGGGIKDTVTFTILPPDLDYVLIVDTPNSGQNEIIDQSVIVGTTIWGYAAGFNDSIGYFGDLSVDWSVINVGGANASSSPDNGTGSQFDAGLNAGQATWTANDGAGHIDTVVFTILDIEVDFIVLTYTPNGPALVSVTLNVGEQVTAYASGYNMSIGYAGLVEVNWSQAPTLGSFNNLTGTSTTFTAGFFGGSTTITGQNLSLGVSDIFSININPPTIDYVILTDSADGSALTTVSLNTGEQVTAYASTYNTTSGFLGLLEVNWSQAPSLGSLDNLTETSTTFTAGMSPGFTTITGENTTVGVSDSFDVSISLPPVDYILITDSPNGSALNTVTLNVGEQITVYVSGYNSTSGYVGPVEVNWSQAPTLGSFDNTTGSSTTFTAGLLGGSTTITGQNLSLGVSDTFDININPPTVDYIILTDSANGSALTTVTLSTGEQVTAYASSYNTTGGFLGLLEVNWSQAPSLGSFDNLTGTSTTFTAGITGGLTTITGENVSLGVSDTFEINIINATADYIQIRNAPSNGGSVITNLTLSVGQSLTLWAAAYNNTAGYLGDFSSTTWTESSGGSVITVTSPGSSTFVQAQMIDGFSTITADYSGIQNSTGVTVNPPTIDFITTTDIPNGFEYTTVTLPVGGQVTAYASGYNGTSGYIGLVDVNWSQAPLLGSFDNTSGTSTTFTAGGTGGLTILTGTNASLGVSDTFDVDIIPPTVDYIILTDTPNGTILTTVTLNVGESVIACVSGYNTTIGYVDLVEVNWSQAPSLGTFNTTTGTSTTFTAGGTGGLATITGSNTLLGVSDAFDVDIIPPTMDYIIITDTPDGTEYTTVTLPVGDQVTAYASGYNDTIGYIGLVEVNWSQVPSLGSFDNDTGTSTTFTAGATGGLTTLTGSNASLGVSDTFNVDIISPTVDYIIITDTPDGIEYITVTLPVGGQVTAYASGYNSTIGYIGLVEVNWSQAPSLGSFTNLTGTSTTFTAGITGGLTTITGENVSLGVSDTFEININNATADYIQIRNAPANGGSVITNLTLSVGQSLTLWAAAYNNTAGYLGDFSSTIWTESSGGSIITVTSPGSSTSVQAQMIGGFSTITADYSGIQNSTGVTVNPPTIDFITITDYPNGSEYTTVTLPVGGQVTAYASGYNDTSGYIGLVEVDWSQAPSLGSFDNNTGTSTTFTAGGTGGLTTLTGSNASLGVSDTFDVDIISPIVDYIILTDTPNGTEYTTVTLPVGGQVTAYASGYNGTSGYIGLVEVNWSQAPSLGSFDNDTGTSTTFTAGATGGLTALAASNTSLGVSDTFDVDIISPTVDYIIITDFPDGTSLTTVTLNVGESAIAFASGYNTTIGYVDLVEVNWSQSPSLGSFNITTGTSTTFTTGLSGGSTIISGESTTLGLNDTFEIIINPPTADYILIRTQPGGGGINLCDPVNYQSYPVGASDVFFGVMYNVTAGYFADAPGDANWTSSNTSIVTVTSPGSNSNITCDDLEWGGPVTITLTASGKVKTTEVTVLEPTVDYIQIRDEPNGLGDIVTNRTYNVWQVEMFYAAGYNDTADYIGEVEAIWWSNDTAVGQVTSPGLWTNFTAQKVDHDSLCQISANYRGIQVSTGALMIFAPRTDFITIVDGPNGGGNWIAGGTYDEGDEDVFWAAGFNFTVDYVKDVDATWESNNTIVGNVTPGPGKSTNFTAGWKGGYCMVTATYGDSGNQTGSLFVINVNQLPTAKADYYNGTGFEGGNYSFSIDITLRVTGRKENIITMELEEDGYVVEEVEVTRQSNQPDIGVISYEMDVHCVYEVVLRYNGHNGGSNPIIVTFEFLNNTYSIHLLFNSQHGEEQTARIKFNDVLQLVGTVFFGAYRSTDVEGYIVDYAWDFGDGNTANGDILAHTYEENGNYTVTLTVTDDEGGTDSDTIIVHMENIDNNNQVNAILGSNASQGYLNGSGQYVVILQCPADLMIEDTDSRKVGLSEGAYVNTIENSFVSKSYSDIEVYFVPKDDRYILKVTGTGIGYYDLSIIFEDNGILKSIRFTDVTCTENTLDTYIIDFSENRITITTNEDNKVYSLDIMASKDNSQDHFKLIDMRLDKEAEHIYAIRDWEELSSGKPVTFFIDEDHDGKIDMEVDLETDLTGDEVDALFVKAPISEPVFPFLLLIIGGFICAIGVGTLLTEVGKWALISLFIPLYSRIKKEELLDQPIRYKIHGYLIGKPGAHFGSIKQDLHIPNGQLVYHLKKLMKADLIYSREDGIKKRFYPKDVPKIAADQQYKGTEEMILEFLGNNSGANQKEIASSLGVSRQVVGYHLNKMEEKGVVRKELEGRETRYYPLENADA
jgi:DNA-binding MarR family transcriptional regulator